MAQLLTTLGEGSLNAIQPPHLTKLTGAGPSIEKHWKLMEAHFPDGIPVDQVKLEEAAALGIDVVAMIRDTYPDMFRDLCQRARTNMGKGHSMQNEVLLFTSMFIVEFLTQVDSQS